MIYLLQILRMLNKTEQRQLVDDISHLDHCDSDLISDVLFNFGIELECDSQLERFADYINKNQSRTQVFKAALNMVNIG